ncbi:MAG: FMN-binding protein [Georgenia sp.]
MRKIVVAGATTAAGIDLLLSYPTSRNQPLEALAPTAASAERGAPSAAAGATAQRGSTSGGSAGQSSASGGSAGQSSASGGSAGQAQSSGTSTGAEVNTRWGVVQVEVTIADGRVTDARAVQFPDGNQQDQVINSYAVPILEQETVAAGTAQIDAVSGATITSGGYIESLQSALDQAGLR